MSILDKLMEKKDILIYLSSRVNLLREEQGKAIENAEPKDREYINERFKGRIFELKRLKVVIEQGELKIECKKMFHFRGLEYKDEKEEDYR